MLATVVAGIVATNTPASAIAGSQFNAGRITDDVVFFSPGTMSVNEIQNFLNSKVPVCDTYHAATNPSYQPPYTCLKDYRQDEPARSAEVGLCKAIAPRTNSTAAQIIYDVANSCGVNPQVLLVLLQKEQSLVTDTWPWSNQYRSATGYGCPDTAPCDSEYYGFFNQVYMAARQFRYYAKSPTLFSYRMGRSNNILYNPSSSCGSSPVYIQNQATAGLYNYTPYQPNAAALNNLYGSGDSCSAYGNRNFWRMFNDWFGASVIGSKPSPLYKSTSTSQLYVIAGGKKFPAPSFEVLGAYGLHNYPAAEVTQSFLDQYTTGDTLTTVAKKENDSSGAFYLFDDGRRFSIDISACAKYPDNSSNPSNTWGIDCFNSNVTKTLANELIDLYTTPDGAMPKMILNQDKVWKMEGGKKRLITHPVFVEVLGGWGSSRWMKDINAAQPIGKMLIIDNAIVKFDNSGALYLTFNSKLYPIQDPALIGAWGLNNAPNYLFPASYDAGEHLAVDSTGLRFFAKDSANTPYVLTSEGKKASILGNSNWSPSQYASLPDPVLDRLHNAPLSQVFRSSTGEIYTLQGNKRRPFPTGNDIAWSGIQSNQIQPVDQSIANMFTYDGAKLAPGRLFKVKNTGEIRYVHGDSASLHVTTTDKRGLDYGKMIEVDATTGAKYPIIGTYP